MNSQVWMELAEEFDKALSAYNNSPDEDHIAPMRPHLRKAGKAYFTFLRNDDPDITTTEEFLAEPIFRNTVDDVGREHRCTDAHDRYWICVLALLGRCGYIIVKNKKLRGMKIPTVSTRQGIEVDWSIPFLHAVGPREGYILGGYLLNERDYVIDVCKASIQACQFLINEYGDLTEEPAEPEQKAAPQGRDGQRAVGRTESRKEAAPEMECVTRRLIEKQEGFLEPKPPEILQKLLWICKHGRKHWKLILLAIVTLLFMSIFVLPKFDLFSKILR